MGQGVGHVLTMPRPVAQKRWCTFVFSVSVLEATAQACFKCGGDNTSCGSIPFGSIVPYNDPSMPYIIGGSDDVGGVRSLTGFIDDVRLYRFHALTKFASAETAISIARAGFVPTALEVPAGAAGAAEQARRRAAVARKPQPSCADRGAAVLSVLLPTRKCPRKELSTRALKLWSGGFHSHPNDLAKQRNDASLKRRALTTCSKPTWDAIGESMLRRARLPKVCKWPYSERVAAANRKVTQKWTAAAVAILERGDGLAPKNLAKAEAILRRAAYHADALALYYLATLTAANATDGAAGTAVDTSGLPYLQMAASAGLPLAQLALAYRFRHGIEVPKDEEIAFGIYKCHAGKALGEMNAVGAHHHTDLIRIDDPRALESYGGESGDQFEWVKVQAEGGHGHAMMELGGIYYWGLHGVARDFAAAFRWFRRAAATGNPDALYTLGVMHRHV